MSRVECCTYQSAFEQGSLQLPLGSMGRVLAVTKKVCVRELDVVEATVALWRQSTIPPAICPKDVPFYLCHLLYLFGNGGTYFFARLAHELGFIREGGYFLGLVVLHMDDPQQTQQSSDRWCRTCPAHLTALSL